MKVRLCDCVKNEVKTNPRSFARQARHRRKESYSGSLRMTPASYFALHTIDLHTIVLKSCAHPELSYNCAIHFEKSATPTRTSVLCFFGFFASRVSDQAPHTLSPYAPLPAY